MKIDYVIVQAGGEGTRLRPYTKNMPKALVSVKNKPLIFHLFDKFPAAKFIIICDYKKEVLARYLEVFAGVSYVMVRPREKGNAAGIKEALTCIPEKRPFLLLWCDLLLGDGFDTLNLPEGNYIGTTDLFPCSWKWEGGVLEKNDALGASDASLTRNQKQGVAGCFLFREKSVFANLPEGGSFTGYLKEASITLKELPMGDTEEIGSVSALVKASDMKYRSRPYNKIIMGEDRVQKDGITTEGEKLLEAEREWYSFTSRKNFPCIPKIFSSSPLVMERIRGTTVYAAELTEEEKAPMLERIVFRLKELHGLCRKEKNPFDIERDYYQKTIERLRKISAAIPFSDKERIVIGGEEKLNPLFHLSLFEEMVHNAYKTCQNFGFIHGDCTFSNLMTDKEGNVYMIDPRGYFGHTPLAGDVDYDWAKLYYSIVGSFDNFNMRKFDLDIGKTSVSYSISPSGWEKQEAYFFKLLTECLPKRIRFIHSIIWLSLASHTQDDYDSMCLAFYNGVSLWNKSAQEYLEGRQTP